jgi:hypothetical protein
VRELHGGLTGAIHRDRDVEQIAIAAGVPPGNVALDGPARTVWFDVMNEAAGQRPLPVLTEKVLELQRRSGSFSPALRHLAPAVRMPTRAPQNINHS